MLNKNKDSYYNVNSLPVLGGPLYQKDQYQEPSATVEYKKILFHFLIKLHEDMLKYITAPSKGP